MTLDQIIEIRRKSQVQQPDGSLSTTLTLVGRAYAAVYPMRGDERNAGQQNEAHADYKFHIHYRSDLSEDDVLVWQGRNFNVRFIADKGPGSIYLMIEAQRGVAI